MGKAKGLDRRKASGVAYLLSLSRDLQCCLPFRDKNWHAPTTLSVPQLSRAAQEATFGNFQGGLNPSTCCKSHDPVPERLLPHALKPCDFSCHDAPLLTSYPHVCQLSYISLLTRGSLAQFQISDGLGFDEWASTVWSSSGYTRCPGGWAGSSSLVHEHDLGILPSELWGLMSYYKHALPALLDFLESLLSVHRFCSCHRGIIFWCF